MTALDLTGTLVGNYLLVRKLGEGGMGAVYEAVHPGLGRRAAVKVILPELSTNSDITARFLREARAANSVRHRGLIEVFDLGQLSSGSPYFVMEFLEGRNLADRLTEGPLTLPEALTVLSECADALGSLHDARMVHRDLKPENIFLIGGEISYGRIKILDFGLIKLLENQDPLGTRTGVLMGTPRYMSPEQCKGQKDIGPPSDVYAMGCVFFEMLAGRPAFPADTPAEAIYMHVMEPPPSVVTLRPGLPPAIESAICRALSKVPAERFASVAEFSAAASIETPPSSAKIVRASPAATTLLSARTHRTRRGRRAAWFFAVAALVTAGLVASRSCMSTRQSSSNGAATGGVQDADTALLTAMDAVIAVAVDGDDTPVEGPPSVARIANETGIAYWFGSDRQQRDPTEAYRWFRRACELGSPAGCENAIFALFRGGIAEAQWLTEARKLDAVCGTHGAACVAGAILQDHPGLAEIACKAGVPSGCLVRAAQATKAAANAKSSEWYRAGDEWAARAVALLDPRTQIDGRLVRTVALAFGIGGESHGVEQNRATATRLLEEGCAASDTLCCQLFDCLTKGTESDPWKATPKRCRLVLGEVLGTLADAAVARNSVSP